jgi:hypothetical protein
MNGAAGEKPAALFFCFFRVIMGRREGWRLRSDRLT